jgi:hypothetical protein
MRESIGLSANEQKLLEAAIFLNSEIVGGGLTAAIKNR